MRWGGEGGLFCVQVFVLLLKCCLYFTGSVTKAFRPSRIVSCFLCQNLVHLQQQSSRPSTHVSSSILAAASILHLSSDIGIRRTACSTHKLLLHLHSIPVYHATSRRAAQALIQSMLLSRAFGMARYRISAHLERRSSVVGSGSLVDGGSIILNESILRKRSVDNSSSDIPNRQRALPLGAASILHSLSAIYSWPILHHTHELGSQLGLVCTTAAAC